MYKIHAIDTNFGITLPAGVSVGYIHTITPDQTTVRTIYNFGSQTIDGSITLAVANGTVVTIQSNGVNSITI